jgi:hypothetical protein
MVPAGYMAKLVQMKPDWLRAARVIDVYSVSNCVSSDFADYVDYWRHNGFWLFDSPQVIREIAGENSIGLEETALFYYELYELEWDGQKWCSFQPEPSVPTNVEAPSGKRLEGFDVVTFSNRNLAQCSPLSCNHLAAELATNVHCLFETFDEAERHVSAGTFNNSEPGPYRIFAVYSVDWP